MARDSLFDEYLMTMWKFYPQCPISLEYLWINEFTPVTASHKDGHRIPS